MPRKDRWLETVPRLVRFERLVREDLMFMAALLLLVITAAGIQIGHAAHKPDGAAEPWRFPIITGGFLVLITRVVVRMIWGPRYKPYGRATR